MWLQLLVHIWRNRETNGKQQLYNLTRTGSMITHFLLPPYEFYWANRQPRDIAISVNSLGTWFFSKEYLCDQYRTSFRNYPVQNRGERGRLPTCGQNIPYAALKRRGSWVIYVYLWALSTQSVSIHRFISIALAHLSGEVGATRHPHGDVHIVAVAVELAGGEGVAQVAVVVLRVALLSLPLVAQVPQVQRERLTCNLR